MRALYLTVVALALSGVVNAQSGPPYNGSGACKSASSLQFALDGVTDDQPKFLSLATASVTSGVALCVAIDCGKTMLFATQFVSPTDGTPNYNHPSIRITGCGGTPFNSTGSSFLNLTYSGASSHGYQFINVGGGASGAFGGSLEIDNVVVTNTTSNCNPMVISTVQLDIHDAAFFPTCGTVTAITVGGTNSIGTARTNSVDDWFIGQYNIRYNRICCGKSVLTQSSANSGNIIGNRVGGTSGGDHRIFDINGVGSGPVNSSRGIRIMGNIFEVNTGDCGIYQHNALGVTAEANWFFDGPSGSHGFCLDNTAVKSAYNWNFIDTTGMDSGLTGADPSNEIHSDFDGLTQIPNKVNFGGFIQGTSAAPAVDASSCTGATIGTGATNLAGTITALPTGSCSVKITFASATAAHGWSCAVSDNTTANLFRQTATTTTTATFAGTSVSGDVLQYGPCIAY